MSKASKAKKRGKEKEDPAAKEAFGLFLGEGEVGLGAEGLQLALGTLGIEVGERENQELLEKAGGTVDLAAFLRLARTLPKTRQDAVEAFDLFDEDQKGFIVREDLVRIAAELQEEFSDQDFAAMLRLAEDAEGLVTKDSFMAFYQAHLAK